MAIAESSRDLGRKVWQASFWWTVTTLTCTVAKSFTSSLWIKASTVQKAAWRHLKAAFWELCGFFYLSSCLVKKTTMFDLVWYSVICTKEACWLRGVRWLWQHPNSKRVIQGVAWGYCWIPTISQLELLASVEETKLRSCLGVCWQHDCLSHCNYRRLWRRPQGGWCGVEICCRIFKRQDC